jgi:hypothetical protein
VDHEGEAVDLAEAARRQDARMHPQLLDQRDQVVVSDAGAANRDDHRLENGQAATRSSTRGTVDRQVDAAVPQALEHGVVESRSENSLAGELLEPVGCEGVERADDDLGALHRLAYNVTVVLPDERQCPKR